MKGTAVAKIELLAGERQPGESWRAILACNDYLRVGPGRSLSLMVGKYSEIQQDTAPTRSKATLFKWSARFSWSARAALYDAEAEQQKNEYTRQVMQSGLALAHERVNRLKTMAELLELEILKRDDGRYFNIWLPDVKQIGAGEFAERVDIVRFNASIFEQWRGMLDDLAKETGGRKIQTTNQNLDIDMTLLSTEQLERIAAGEDPIVVLATPGPGGAGTPAAPGPA